MLHVFSKILRYSFKPTKYIIRKDSPNKITITKIKSIMISISRKMELMMLMTNDEKPHENAEKDINRLKR